MIENYKKNRKYYIDVLSVIACFSVVMLHANGIFWVFQEERYWITSNIIENIFYFAVPIFFMISGINLIDYRDKYNTREYALKRSKKVLIPYLAWSIIAIAFEIFLGEIQIENINLLNLLNWLYNGSYLDVYWFFPALFSVYLVIPFLGLFIKEKRRETFKYLIILSFLINSLLPFLLSFQGSIQINSNFTFSIISGYSFYLILGYYLDNYKIARKLEYILIFLGIFSLFIMIIGTQYYSFRDHVLNTSFKGYLSPLCILYTTSIFLIIKRITHIYLEKQEIILNIFTKFSSVTFGVYLIHYYFFKLIYSYTNIDTKSIIYRVFGGILVFLISSLIIFVVRKNKILSKMVP